MLGYYKILRIVAYALMESFKYPVILTAPISLK